MGERQPWEQREGEPDAAYNRFLAYRNLGPGRTIQRAAALARSQNPTHSHTKARSDQWRADSAAYEWVARALAWDRYNLDRYGEEAAIAYGGALKAFAENVAIAAQTLKPKDYDHLIRAFEFLAKVFPGEAIAGVASGGASQRERGE